MIAILDLLYQLFELEYMLFHNLQNRRNAVFHIFVSITFTPVSQQGFRLTQKTWFQLLVYI